MNKSERFTQTIETQINKSDCFAQTRTNIDITELHSES